jgi:hypothetical protein
MLFILVSLLLLWKQESLPSFVVSSRPAQQGKQPTRIKCIALVCMIQFTSFLYCTPCAQRARAHSALGQGFGREVLWNYKKVA